jgi:AraC-like DNA-binding protein
MQCLQQMLKTFEARWNDLSILYAEPWSEPWILRPDLRDDFEIYVVEKGQGEITIGEQSYPVEEGNAFVLYSIDGNSFVPDKSCVCRMNLVTFCIKDAPDEDHSKEQLIQEIRSSKAVLELRDPEILQTVMYRMNREILMQKPGYMFRMKSMLVQFIMLMEEEAEHKRIETKSIDAASRQSVDRIAMYLYDHADQQITLNDIADEVNLNQRYICTLYRRYTGKSIIQHLNEIRITKAKHLLTHTLFTITQIAQETGFSSGQYFARIFKRETGMSPRQYRFYGS